MLMEPGSGPLHNPAPPPDLNFNSPDHHSSQDGSFIQDEAGDMQLIMDWGSPGGRAAGDKTGAYVPTSVLTSSWLSRAQAKWATDLDANIAELDFDAVDTQDIFNGITSRHKRDPADSTGEMDASFWEESPIHKDWNQNLKGSLLELSLSPSQSLFSSEDAGAEEESGKQERLEEMFNAAGPVFISTDSLDMSALMEDGELEAACATRKRDYMLTFEGAKIGESTMASSTVDFYADAALTDVSDNVVSPSDCLLLVPEDEPAPSTITSWGRIRRSCQLPNLSSPHHSSTPKSTSLPNLSRSPIPSLSGAGENLLSETSVPIYDLSESMSSSQYRSCLPVGAQGLSGDGISLLRMFQKKLSTNRALESLARDELGGSQESSGYITGEGTEKIAAVRRTQAEETVQVLPKTPIEPENGLVSFEDNQDPDYQPTTSRVQDYEYSEFYVNGRYIDVNHNEIGYSPPSTTATQEVEAEETGGSPRTEGPPHDRWITLSSPRLTRIAPIKPPRTFATLLQTKVEKGVVVSSAGKTDAATSPTLIRASSSVSLGTLKESATQVPVYVVDQSVQTSCWDNGRLVKTLSTTSTTSIWSPSSPTAPVYVHVRSFSDVSPRPTSLPGSIPNVANPDLSFLKLGFSPPALFPGAPPFPLSLLSQSQLDPTQLHQLQPPSLDTPVDEEDELELPEERREKTNPFTLDLGPPLSDLALPSLPSLLSRSPNQGLGQHSEDSAYPSGNSSSKDSPTESKPKKNEDGGVTRDRDSGLGSSGPSHIQDWDSLAALLPKDVVSTCSFFKANNVLLKEPDYSIDKPRSKLARLGRRGGQKGSRPVSEPSFERWRRLLPNTIYESILEEDGDPHHCEPHPGCRGGPQRCGEGSRLSVSCSSPPRGLCCPHSCPRSCPHSSHVRHHSCGCGPCGYTPRRRSLPRWRQYDSRRNSARSSQDSESESDWGGELGASSGWSSEEEERVARKRPRPTSLDTRRVRSANNMRDQLESSFLRGESEAGRLGRGQSEMGLGAESCASKACATCFRVRSPSDERPPLWAMKELSKWPEFAACDCETSDVLADLEKDERRRRRNQNLVFFLSGLRSEEMCEEEIAIRKTPLYLQKKQMVELVLSECEALVTKFSGQEESRKAAETVFKAAGEKMIPALKALLSDGILPGCSLWALIKASTTLGPATKSIHQLVSELKEEKTKADMDFKFFYGLLDLNSLDCWLSYLALKGRVLVEHYEDGAFMRRATTAYRTQFARLMMGLQSLSLLPFASRAGAEAQTPRLPSYLRRPAPRSSSVPVSLATKGVRRAPVLSRSVAVGGERRRYSLVPTRLPADSRVPKSSSVPSKLTVAGVTGKWEWGSGKSRGSPSRIPVLKDSPSLPNKSTFPNAVVQKPKFVCTIDRVAGNRKRGILACGKGETLELVGTPLGRFLRCKRNGEEGFVPRELATFVTFL